MGTRLVVGLSTDDMNRVKKGRTPVYPYNQRKAMLEALQCVDLVFAEESLERKAAYCMQFKADLLVMGDDWAGKFDDMGVPTCYLPRTPDISTTETIKVVQAMACEDTVEQSCASSKRASDLV